MVMLPGAAMRAHDFRERGLVQALHAHAPDIDAVMVEVDAGEYVPATFGKRLQGEVLGPLRERGYRHVWLAGISLGAYGALRLLQEGAEDVAGVLLLSPFLATRGTVARVLDNGGLDCWVPLPAQRAGDDESLLCWLKDHLLPANLARKFYLGWGTDDRYADAGRLLAARLPHDQVFSRPGDHDWPTWAVLWQDMLAAVPFATTGRPQ